MNLKDVDNFFDDREADVQGDPAGRQQHGKDQHHIKIREQSVRGEGQSHHRHRLPRQKRHPQRHHLPPPALGHRRPGTLPLPHPQLPQGRSLRHLRLRPRPPRDPHQPQGMDRPLPRQPRRANGDGRLREQERPGAGVRLGAAEGDPGALQDEVLRDLGSQRQQHRKYVFCNDRRHHTPTTIQTQKKRLRGRRPQPSTHNRKPEIRTRLQQSQRHGGITIGGGEAEAEGGRGGEGESLLLLVIFSESGEPYYLLRKMSIKNAMMQLTVEVGRCLLPPLPYTDYSLSVRLTNDLAAATSFKQPADGCLNFGTRLFLRTEKAFLEGTAQCSVVVTAIGQKASRIQVAAGEARVSQQGQQVVRLQAGGGSAFLEAELEFCWAAWEVKQTKTNNNRAAHSKSHLSQKQSSCDQKQPSSAQPPHTRDSLLAAPHAPHSSHFNALQPSRSEKILPDQSTELETSANTIQHAKTEENLNKSEDSGLLTMQIKIDQLEERIQALQAQLTAKEQQLQTLTAQHQQQTHKTAQTAHLQEEKLKDLEKILQQEKEKNSELTSLYEHEKARVVQLEESKEQLSEMLILEEEKNNISSKHIERLNRLIETLGNAQDGEDFNPIEEKDEIIMLNQELEDELTNKNIAINQMKLEIEQLKQKIILIQTNKPKKTPPVYDAQISEKTTASTTKVSEPRPSDPDKNKLEKKTSEKIIPTPRKSDVDVPPIRPKDTKKPKEKEPEKKQPKPDPTSNKKPVVPKNPREVKSPAAVKQEAKPKGKGKPLLKIEQKATMESEKKSQAESSLTSMVSLDVGNEAPNLMIHSRSHEGELSRLQSS